MARAPRIAGALLARLLPPDEREFLLGDLEEQFVENVRRRGRWHAAWIYRRQAAAAFWHRGFRRSWTPHPPARHGDFRMSILFNELRLVVRQLVRQPSYSLVAIVSLALAITANAVVYGMVDALLLNPFRFPEVERLVTVGSTFPKLNGEEGFIEQHSTLEVEDFRRASSLVSVTAFDLGNRAVSNGSGADRIWTALVLDDPFPALGVPPIMGRGFTREELGPNGPPVAVISHRLWQRMYGGDRALLNRTINVNGQPRTLVGIIAPGPSLLGTDLWIPWGANPIEQPRNQRQFTLVARLAAGAGLDSANAELATIAGRTTTQFASQFPEYQGWRLRAVPWNEAVTGQVSGVANMLLAAGGVVVLIACANLTGLMLARLNARRRELAVRAALGAGQWRLIRLLVLENVTLAVAATAAGLLVAQFAMAPIPSVLPTAVMSLGDAPVVNLRVALYCGGVALLAALLTTLVPLWQLRGRSHTRLLRDGGAVTAGRQRMRQVLVVAELALAVVLLVGASLLLRSFMRVQQVDPGFNPERVLTMRLTLAVEKYGQRGAPERFFAELVERLRGVPGVSSVAATSQFPPAQNFTIQFRVEGAPAPSETLPTALVTLTMPGYFDVLEQPRRHGRVLTDADRAGAPLVVVVNEAFMRRHLDGKPEGRIRVGNAGRVAEVVGVVANARNNGLIRPAMPEIYAAIDQVGSGGNQYFLLVRTVNEPRSAEAAVRQAVASLDPDQPLYLVQTLEEAIAGSLFTQRVSLALVGVFALGAVVVAAVGIYGLVSYWVASRAREIGIRVALGASRGEVRRLILGQTGRVLLLGGALGLAGGIAAARFGSSLLYATSTFDPLALAGVVVTLVLLGLAATWLPSRRALSVDPVRVLRNE